MGEGRGGADVSLPYSSPRGSSPPDLPIDLPPLLFSSSFFFVNGRTSGLHSGGSLTSISRRRRKGRKLEAGGEEVGCRGGGWEGDVVKVVPSLHLGSPLADIGRLIRALNGTCALTTDSTSPPPPLSFDLLSCLLWGFPFLLSFLISTAPSAAA